MTLIRSIFVLIVTAFSCLQLSAADKWTLEADASAIHLSEIKPMSDHIEMSGEMVSAVLRWGISEDKSFFCERSLVFPMLRTVPNNTHASLMHRIGTDIPSLISVNGLSMRNENVLDVWIDGYLGVESEFSVGKSNIGTGAGIAPKPSVRLERKIFPSVKEQMLVESYSITNISTNKIIVYVPEFTQMFNTLPEKGVTGSYIVRSDITGSGTYVLAPKETVSFGALFQAYREGENPHFPNHAEEFAARRDLVSLWDSSLVLETPDKVIDREFRFAKIRASESIYKTAGGYMHGPGGESYYAAIWANDQAEYINPYFPFGGYAVGNESAYNSYKHFARFMNESFEPIPSSIIAEGLDVWNGAGDRGDAAMIAHGASRYVLAKGDRKEAKDLWPLIEWCLEYCNRKLTADGVVASDTDELEGRFPAGDANLCTSCLYYDALLSATMLCKEIGLPSRKASLYAARAKKLAVAIEKHFGASLGGFETYRYYDGNTLLRSWICMPLIVGLESRAAGTIAALTSPALMTEEGLLTEEGSTTFWDRSTLYSLRGIYCAGDTGTATDFLHKYSQRRLLGDHVPYPIEAFPEGSQRHLSAESGLYCRVITEGMFGIRPTGFRTFSMTPRLTDGWDKMALRRIKAFGGDFDVEVSRSGEKILIKVSDHITGKAKSYTSSEGKPISVNLDKI